MKKKLIIVAGLMASVALVVGFALITRDGSEAPRHAAATVTPKASIAPKPSATPVATDSVAASPETIVSPAASDPASASPLAGAASAIGERKDIPVLEVPVKSSDLVDSIYNSDGSAEREYLSDLQKEELDETVVSSQAKPQAEFPNKKSFAIEWSAPDGVSALLPSDLPAQAPLYAIGRDQDAKVFDKVKKVVKDFGLKATVLRMSKDAYAAFDLESGDHRLGYDINKDIFEIPELNIPMTGKETPMNALEWFLYEKGLLRFPYSAVFVEMDDGSKVVRFSPELELPVIRFDSVPAQGNAIETGAEEPFLVGVGETIDAKLDREGNLRELYAFFPNLEKWKDLVLMNKDEIKNLLLGGKFAFGDVQLQHPAALPLEERQQFYDLVAKDEIKITDAELFSTECGYYQETEKNYQLFYQPVCIAYGNGYVGDYETIFGVVLSIAK